MSISKFETILEIALWLGINFYDYACFIMEYVKKKKKLI